MNDRVRAGVVAIAGAVLLGIGCWLPYESHGDTDFEIFQRHGPHTVLYFAIESATVMVVAAVLGVLLIRAALPVFYAGVLTAIGLQTSLLWVGYIGYGLSLEDLAHGEGPRMRAGGWIGIVGALVIATAGILALRAASTESGRVAPADWYADPHDPARLRYWSGSRWTDHTADRPTRA